MTKRDEATRSRRLVLEQVNGVEQIRLRKKQHWPLILFLSLWLLPWMGVLVYVTPQIIERFELRLLLGWAALAPVPLLSAAVLAWYLVGSVVVRVVRGDVEICYKLFGCFWVRRFQGSIIRDLAVAATPDHDWYGSCIRFNHQGRTIHAATGIERVEAQTIVDFLSKRLPSSVNSLPIGKQEASSIGGRTRGKRSPERARR